MISGDFLNPDTNESQTISFCTYGCIEELIAQKVGCAELNSAEIELVYNDTLNVNSVNITAPTYCKCKSGDECNKVNCAYGDMGLGAWRPAPPPYTPPPSTAKKEEENSGECGMHCNQIVPMAAYVIATVALIMNH